MEGPSLLGDLSWEGSQTRKLVENPGCVMMTGLMEGLLPDHGVSVARMRGIQFPACSFVSDYCLAGTGMRPFGLLIPTVLGPSMFMHRWLACPLTAWASHPNLPVIQHRFYFLMVLGSEQKPFLVF